MKYFSLIGFLMITSFSCNEPSSEEFDWSMLCKESPVEHEQMIDSSNLYFYLYDNDTISNLVFRDTLTGDTLELEIKHSSGRNLSLHYLACPESNKDTTLFTFLDDWKKANFSHSSLELEFHYELSRNFRNVKYDGFISRDQLSIRYKNPESGLYFNTFLLSIDDDGYRYNRSVFYDSLSLNTKVYYDVYHDKSEKEGKDLDFYISSKMGLIGFTQYPNNRFWLFEKFK